MSDHTRERMLYESGLWLTEISKRAWNEMRSRQRLEDEGLDVRGAEIARLEHEQRVEIRRGNRCFPQVLAHRDVLSLELPLRDERTLAELLGVA